MKLNHLKTKTIADSNIFNNISSYDGLIKNIVKGGKLLGVPGSEEYNEFTGAALEVFAEFFFARYGTDANPKLGVRLIEDTSRNKYQAGYDFTYENFKCEPCLLQVKFRSNPTETFIRKDFASFALEAFDQKMATERLIWFTNLSNSGETGIFNPMCAEQGNRIMRVFGRDEQEALILRDPDFWKDLNNTVNLSKIAPTDFIEPPKLWEHQERMNSAVQHILENEGRGSIICATGGGKTRAIYQNMIDGYLKHNYELQVIVAPTIDLLRQHHETFRKYETYKNDVSIVHFRTGDSSEDNWSKITQTTSVEDMLEHKMNDKSKRTLIFVTYASEGKLFNGLKKANIKADIVYWDEFHHTVKQKQVQKEHLLSIPSKRNLFYSASIKRGRTVCAMNKELFGPKLCEIKYSELRKKGILVPKIIVKVIRLQDNAKIKKLERELKKAASVENFDLRTAVMEAAGTIIARKDMLKSGPCNLLTFSKAVPICKEIVSNEVIRKEFDDCLLNTVHSGVRSKYRKEIYDIVKKSEDSVLCQYSVVKEGIDINPFNAVVFSREMDVIGTQQAIGRVIRVHEIDKQNFAEGLISIDNLEGWKKYNSTLYVIIHKDDSEDFRKFLKDLIRKLQHAGLEKDDYAFADIDDTIHGTKDEETSEDVVIPPMRNIIKEESIKSAVNAVYIEIEEDEENEIKNEFFEEIEKNKFEDLMNNIMINNEVEKDWVITRKNCKVTFPAKTKFRFKYKNQEYNGFIRNEKLFMNEQEFDSPSTAVSSITGKGANGWTVMECLIPDNKEWKVLSEIRKEQNMSFIEEVVQHDDEISNTQNYYESFYE